MTLWLRDGQNRAILPYYILSHLIYAYFYLESRLKGHILRLKLSVHQ